MATGGGDWSREEVEAIVADYLRMLAMQLAGQTFNKSEHRRQLSQKLQDRSDGSIEFKHCNVSAVMLELGFPALQGYQPRGNYQGLLIEVVASQVHASSELDPLALSVVEQRATLPAHIDFSGIKTDAPVRQHQVAAPVARAFQAIKRDYLEREARNRSLGAVGEEFVLRFEHWRLALNGHQALADRVERVSATRGDGLGFDVLSFNLDGSERFIEVKTTSFGRETPFFVTDAELDRSKLEGDQYHLYRLFDFRRTPRLFDLPGALDQNCFLDPVSYRATFG